MSETSTEIRFLGSQSKRSALLTFLSLVLVSGSTIYSVYSLSELDKTKTTLQIQLNKLETHSGKLHRINEELQKANDSLEAKHRQMVGEISTLEAKYGGLKKAVEQTETTAQAGSSTAASTLKVVGERVYEIKTTAKPTGQQTNRGPAFDFRLYINGSPQVLADIDKVTYVFEHPTFSPGSRVKISTNKDEQFSVGYIRWGCLDPVNISIKFKDSMQAHTNFNMCRGLGW